MRSVEDQKKRTHELIYDFGEKVSHDIRALKKYKDTDYIPAVERQTLVHRLEILNKFLIEYELLMIMDAAAPLEESHKGRAST